MRMQVIGLSNGQELAVREWRPADEAAGAVLCLHGVESHAAWFAETAEALNRRNLAVVAFDRPGWGRSEGVRGHLASYADALGQVAEVATTLRERFPAVHLAGLSWGGLLAAYAGLRRGFLFDSITLIAPGICARTRPSVWQSMAVAARLAAGQPTARIRLPIRARQFTRRADRLDYIRQDPLRVQAVSARFCLETVKMRRFVADTMDRRQLPPARALLAADDTIVDNARTRALLARGNVSTRTYAGRVHSLVFEDPERVAEDIVEVAYRGRRPARPRRVAVMGAGAVGSLVGGLLALGGHQVTLVARQAHADAVARQGLKLHLGGGARAIHERLTAVTAPADVGDPPDLVLLTVKSFVLEQALADMRPLVGPGTSILCLMNGVRSESAIAQAFPDNPILAGAICAYVQRPAPGRVVWADDRGGLAGGLFQGRDTAARALWEAVLAGTGMDARYVAPAAPGEPPAWKRVKWSKLMLNVAFNALSAVTGLSTPQILSHAEYGPLAARALQEGFAVMRRMRIAPVNLPGYPVRQLAGLARMPAGVVCRVLARKTAGQASGASSTAQDLARGRGSTEIDEINGAICRAGCDLGLATPANDRLCALVKDAACGADTAACAHDAAPSTQTSVSGHHPSHERRLQP